MNPFYDALLAPPTLIPAVEAPLIPPPEAFPEREGYMAVDAIAQEVLSQSASSQNMEIEEQTNYPPGFLESLDAWLVAHGQKEKYQIAYDTILDAYDNDRDTLLLQGLELDSLPEAIWMLSSLKELDLSNNNLSSISLQISQLSYLEILSVQKNDLITLPNTLSRLSHLRKISAYDNCLSILPNTLGGLRSLQGLMLASNKLQVLPDSFCDLIALKVLDVSQNKITQLPNRIGSLVELHTLNIKNNLLKTIPDSIKELRKLRKLDISHNRLASLSQSMEHLSLLRILNLSYNKLTDLPQNMSGWAMLHHLDLSHNQIKKLPCSMSNLTRLDTFNFSNNLLTVLPDFISNLYALQTLDLSYNLLKTLSNSIWNMPNLLYFKCNNNVLAFSDDFIPLNDTYLNPTVLYAIMPYLKRGSSVRQELMSEYAVLQSDVFFENQKMSAAQALWLAARSIDRDHTPINTISLQGFSSLIIGAALESRFFRPHFFTCISCFPKEILSEVLQESSIEAITSIINDLSLERRVHILSVISREQLMQLTSFDLSECSDIYALDVDTLSHEQLYSWQQKVRYIERNVRQCSQLMPDNSRIKSSCTLALNQLQRVRSQMAQAMQRYVTVEKIYDEQEMGIKDQITEELLVDPVRLTTSNNSVSSMLVNRSTGNMLTGNPYPIARQYLGVVVELSPEEYDKIKKQVRVYEDRRLRNCQCMEIVASDTQTGHNTPPFLTLPQVADVDKMAYIAGTLPFFLQEEDVYSSPMQWAEYFHQHLEWNLSEYGESITEILQNVVIENFDRLLQYLQILTVLFPGMTFADKIREVSLQQAQASATRGDSFEQWWEHGVPSLAVVRRYMENEDTYRHLFRNC